MNRTMTDTTGARVTVELHRADRVRSYVVALTDEEPVGRADFIDIEDTEKERVFFHTEVDRAYGKRGLAGLLLAEALADSIRDQVVVIPVCPFFARHLRDHGEEFIAAGGRYRKPTPADIGEVNRAIRTDAPAR